MQFLFTILLVLLISIGTDGYDYLTVTALVTNAQNHSALECWRFSTPLAEEVTPGVASSLSFTFNTSTVEYTVLPPRFNGGVHNAPVPQIVAFTTGLAHISLPYPVAGNASGDEAWFVGGNQGLLVAIDTTGEGHITEYPSEQVTVALSIPFRDGVIPAHQVLSQGPCHFSGIGEV